MSFIKKLFGSKKVRRQISSTAEFWEWFSTEEKILFSAVKTRNQVQEYLQKIIDKLQELNPDLYGLIGMHDDITAELVITPEGDIKNIVFAEEIASAAPAMPDWKITALKPEMGFESISIEMNDFTFNTEKLKFYTLPDDARPDEIEIHLLHEDYVAENHNEIANGALIFLDNAIGEITMATQIDDVFLEASANGAAIIPIEKLKDYLLWREKEFVEKYEGIRYDTENDEYTGMEATDENDMPMIAMVNQKLLSWDAKASHPWMLVIEIVYKGNKSGMPDNDTYALMNEFEETIMEKLKDSDGYLNTGRQTYKNERTIFFACKEFRECSKVTSNLIKDYTDKLRISYSIYKDKYWKTMDRFMH
ncbi:DUF695 domain-containing protein [Ferruginibacter sp.]